MKKYFVVFLLLCLIAVPGMAQDEKTNTIKVRKPVAVEGDSMAPIGTRGPTYSTSTGALLIPEQPPEYPGGAVALAAFLKKNTKYPVQAQKARITGRVLVGITVDTSGKVSAIKLIRGLGYGCDEEALRVVRSMKAVWTPGKMNGKPVSQQFTVPVFFR